MSDISLQQINHLQERIRFLVARVEHAASELNTRFSGDLWIARSYRSMLTRLKELNATLENDEWLFTGARAPHPVALEEMLSSPTGLYGSVSSSVARWRVGLKSGAGSLIPTAELHGVFHLYDCHNLDGRFSDENTILLNKDTPDSEFFAPPAGISLAVDAAHQQSRSDRPASSSPEEAREALAELERTRRQQPGLTFENIALTSDVPQSLTTLFSLLESEWLKGRFIVTVPNDPALLGRVEQYFDLERLALNENYDWDEAELRRRLADDETAGHLFTIVCDAAKDENFQERLASLSSFCAETDRYLIVLENSSSDEAGIGLDPIRFKRTVTITNWSRAYDAQGLKISHVLADRDLIERLYKHADDVSGCSGLARLLCKTLVSLELGRRAGCPQELPEELEETLSASKLLFKEFNLWHEVNEAHGEFSRLVMDLIFNTRWFDSLKSTTADPNAPSCHYILRTHLKGSSYRTSLAILAAKNVSALPIDCLLPPEEDRHDLRVTTGVQPGRLVQGLTAACEELDNLYARQTQTEWLHADDKIWLEQAGLFNLSPRLNFWGHTRRVRLRLEQLASALGLTPPSHVLRGATLHDLGKVWSLMAAEDARKEWARLAGTEASAYPWAKAQRDTAIAERLISSNELSMPVLPVKLKEFLLRFFSDAPGETFLSHWRTLLDVADKTSDFKITGPITLESLENCLHLKFAQVSQRYPQHLESLGKEFDRVKTSLRRLFASYAQSNTPEEKNRNLLKAKNALH